MQKGSILRTRRTTGPDVWEFRWREPGPDGRRKHRRMVVGTLQDLPTKEAALEAVQGILHSVDHEDPRVQGKAIRLRMLVEHYLQKELAPENNWKSHSTKVTVRGYINKWILPRWGRYVLSAILAGEVELWLRKIKRAESTRAKIRNMMSGLFVHAQRHGIYHENPIALVRQSAKRSNIPDVLTLPEAHALIDALPFREWVMVLVDLGTGLRMGELFALKWGDINFETLEINVVRSVVMQVVGPCKTESSKKPVPLDPYLAQALRLWRQHTLYDEPHNWVFASPLAKGSKPYWAQTIMRKVIRPTAKQAGIQKKIGWHTFRHTYTTLLNANNTDPKVMQELLRHGSVRVTLDLYAQAVTPQKRTAQSAVVKQLRAEYKNNCRQ